MPRGRGIARQLGLAWGLHRGSAMDLVIQALREFPVDGQPLEIVERKGLGHPDSICDALADELSLALCRYYHQSTGAILHHNVDKALLVGGRSAPAFGGGRLLEPIEIHLAGRAVSELGGETVPVPELAADVARSWMDRNLHALDFDRHVRLFVRVHPGSEELRQVFDSGASGLPVRANDTSCGVGFAPLSDLESTVLRVERQLTDPGRPDRHPAIGEDVKVMGIRRGDRIHLTVSCALVDRYLGDREDYRARKQQVWELARSAAHAVTRREVELEVNAADDPGRGSLFLTVTGTSAESGDDGQVGRGNRFNGLITPYRPMTLEAVSGKNPVSHVGRLYNMTADRIARSLVTKVEGIDAAYCYLVSRIGHPITDPAAVDVRIRPSRGRRVREVRARVEQTVGRHLSELDDWWKTLLCQAEPAEGGVTVSPALR